MAVQGGSRPRRAPYRDACGALLAALLVALVVAAAPATAKGASPQAEAGLAWLSQHLDASLAPVVAEAAHAAGKDLRSWPSQEGAVSRLLQAPNGTALMPKLRPLHAQAWGFEDLDVMWQRVPWQPVLDAFDGSQFGEPTLLLDDAWSIRVLDAWHVHPEALDAAATTLAAQQHPGGGWPWHAGGEPDVDSTGMVLVALQAAGHLSPEAAQRAVAYLGAGPGGATRAPTGWGTTPEAAANCDSTVWALRGITAARAAAPDGTVDLGVAKPAWDFLEGLQDAGGAFRYQAGGTPNALCTAEASGAFADYYAGRLVASPVASTPTLGAAPALAVLLASAVTLASAARRQEP